MEMHMMLVCMPNHSRNTPNTPTQVSARLDVAARFGATPVLVDDAAAVVHRETDGRGVDVAMEVCFDFTQGYMATHTLPPVSFHAHPHTIPPPDGWPS